MKYIAYLQQDGGCDYSIGCGHGVFEIEAEDIIEATKKLKIEVLGKWLKEDGEFEEGYWGEYVLKSIVIFEVSQLHKIPLQDWYKEGQNKIDKFKKNADKEDEIAEYQRLKKKYEVK